MAHAVIILSDQGDGSVKVECDLAPDAAGVAVEDRTPAQRVFRELMRMFVQQLEAEVEADFVIDSDRVSTSIDCV